MNNPAIKNLHYFTDPALIDDGDTTDYVYKTQRQPLIKTRTIGFLTFAVNSALDVRGYHLVNILIHTANAMLLYWIIILTFRTPWFPAGDGVGRSPSSGSRDHIALFTAFIFAVHPIQTQAVTYIIQRFTSLATLFSLLALLFIYSSC